ncbi:MAG: adenine phosphoribosyltransferase [Bdellovibrionales bacterium]
MKIDAIQKMIREVPNFPKEGVLFKDITPILEDGKAFQSLAKIMAEHVHPSTNKLVAIESRGFILGAAVAQHLSCGLVLVRKPGKLPRPTIRENYLLEYGSDSLEIHADSLTKDDQITIIDDVLATGGTASAVEKLCHKLGANVLGSLFLLEILALEGRKKLTQPSQSLFN